MPTRAKVKRMIESEQRTHKSLSLTELNLGAVNGATVSAVEYGHGRFHTTVLTLADTPIVTNGGATNAIQYGGVKVYDFPTGLIQMMGCLAALTIDMDSSMSGYFNDGTPEGDLAVGSTIANSAEALGSSDTSDDDMIDAFAYTMAAFAVATAAEGVSVTAPAVFNGTSGALDANVNITIDASEQPAAQAVTLLISGTIILNWMFCGDQ